MSGIAQKPLSCPVCGEDKIDPKELEQNDFQCPSCQLDLVVKIIGDVVIPIQSNNSEGGFDIVEVPESPIDRRERFKSEYDVQSETASKLTTDLDVADFFEEVAESTDSRVAATFVVDTLLGELNYRDMDISKVNPDEVVDVVSALAEDSVTWRSATKVIRDALDDEERIDKVFSERDVEKTDEDTLSDVVDDVLSAEQDAVDDYLDGTEEAMNHLVGQVMAKTNGQADAREARERLQERVNQRIED